MLVSDGAPDAFSIFFAETPLFLRSSLAVNASTLLTQQKEARNLRLRGTHLSRFAASKLLRLTAVCGLACRHRRLQPTAVSALRGLISPTIPPT